MDKIREVLGSLAMKCHQRGLSEEENVITEDELAQAEAEILALFKPMTEEGIEKIIDVWYKDNGGELAGCFCRSLAHALYPHLPRFTEAQLWGIFAEVKGCKKNREDCSFKKCSSWAGCENLIQALLKAEEKNG